MLPRFLYIALIFAMTSRISYAQTQPTLLTGTVTEKKNAQLFLVKYSNGKTERVADYVIDPLNRDFAFSFVAEPQAKYKLGIQLMKQGHRHLEFEKNYTFPLALNIGQHNQVKISPSLLDTVTRKGFELRTSSEIPKLVHISGKLLNANFGGTISLERVVDGSLSRLTGSNFSKTNSSFSLLIPVQKEAFYYLTTLGWRLRIYLKPADNLQLNINAKTITYEVINGSPENLLVNKWNILSQPLTSYGYFRTVFTNDSLNTSEYQRDYSQLQPLILQFRENIKTGNKKFNQLLKTAVDVDNQYAPLYLSECLLTKNNKPFSSKSQASYDSPVFTPAINQGSVLNNTTVLGIGEAMRFIHSYALHMIPSNNKSNFSQVERLSAMLDAIPNDTLRSMLFKEQLASVELNNLSEFNTNIAPLEKYATTWDAKSQFNQLREQFIGDTAWIGKSSYDFSLPDTTGKMVSMKNFKGKIVLIDVWATWCGPCKGEMPFMKALEEEYRDKKIVFVGISLDQAKDKQKWKNYVEKQQLQGVQLLDDFGKAFGRKYKIAGIPRFMLIDKKGNWIEVRCPHPSDTEALKKYIDEALNSEG